MNLGFFKNKAEQKYGSIENFSEKLGLSKNAVYKWLKSDHLPEERISQIVDTLELNEEELSDFFAVPKVELFFRKVGNTATKEERRENFKSLANTFFKIDANSYAVDENILSATSSQSTSAIASYLRSLLSLEKDEPATIYKTAAQLKRHNINLFFFPFERARYQLNTNRNREVAFTAKKGNRIIIFLDTKQTFDQINFNICHELTHIVCGHKSDVFNQKEEELCNDVAAELVFPKQFIANNQKGFEPFMSSRTDWNTLLEAFQTFESDFDWSPMGICLALTRHSLIKKDSIEYKKLMRLHNNYRDNTKTVDELFYQKFQPDSFDSLSVFFKNEIQKDKDIFKPIFELKKAATFNKLSYKRFAEIFGIDSGDADELVNSWRLQEEELERAQESVNEPE